MLVKTVVQFRPRASLKGGLAKHIRGKVRNAAAKPRPGMEPAVLLVDRVEACDLRFKAAMKARGKKRGQRPKPVLEIVFCGPRVDTGPWQLHHALAWARHDCLPFIERRLAPDCLALAVLHSDEGSWHWHALISGCVPGMPMGVDSVRAKLSAGYAEKVMLKGRHRREARGIVDAYQAEVGKFWGFVEPAKAVNILPRKVDVELARRLRIQDQLAIAEYELGKAENERRESWTTRVRELQEALETGDLSAIDYAADPVPDYSPEAWAERVVRISAKLGLKREDVMVALACMEIRMRKIHQQRQSEREAGKSPYGLAELQKPEQWESTLIDEMAQPGEEARVAKWVRIAGLDMNVLPRPTAPQPSKEFLEHVAKRRRIQAQLETAKEELEKLEGFQLDDFLENQRHTDQVLAEMVNAWRNRVTMLKQALETSDFGPVDVIDEDGPVPGYSAGEWAAKKERLEEGAAAETADDDPGEVSHDAHLDAAVEYYESGRDADPEAGAADGPDAEIQPEKGPE